MIDVNDISICIFGSHARGQKDEYSDKDVLIAAPSKCEASKVIDAWGADGWSVAFYTWNRLKKMASIGSLFVQHLKQDGIIQQDPVKKLTTILSTFAPKPCYKDTILSSEDMARPLDRIPLNKWEIQMQCDVLYTYTRNIGILQLASIGKYEFEYYKIIENLANIHSLSGLEFSALLKLRPLKTQYRSREISDLDNIKTLTTSRAAAEKMFDQKFSQMNSRNDVRLLSVPYATLRDIEARIISYCSPPSLDVLTTGSLIDDYWEYILNPRQYSWSTKTINAKDIYLLNEVISNVLTLRHSA